jgi:hypothetical protein
MANSTTEMECCHNPAPVEQKESHTCCTIEEPVEPEKSSCNMFEMAASSLDNCGCIHELNEIDETVLTSIKVDYSQFVIIQTEISNDLSTNNEFSNASIQNLVYLNTVPIYITVSSYLI